MALLFRVEPWLRLAMYPPALAAPGNGRDDGRGIAAPRGLHLARSMLRFSRAATGVGVTLAVALTSLPAMHGQVPAPAVPSPVLQVIVDRAVTKTLNEFIDRKLLASQLAVSLVDLRDPAKPKTAQVRGTEPIYPASVIKLFYLAAAHRWLEDKRLADTAELRRAMKDMIVDSSNDATHYVIDLLTGTTSGAELSADELKLWFEKRGAVTRYFASIGYPEIIASKKPWGDGPYGRESQAIQLFEPKRNQLTTDATARLLTEIATGRCVTATRSAEMMTLLARDPGTSDPDPDNQAKFTGPALPTGARLWSKAGWTSQTRHDAAYIELGDGAKFVLVIFTTSHANERDLIPAIAAKIIEPLAALK